MKDQRYTTSKRRKSDMEDQTKLAAYDDETNELETIVVEVINSNLYSMKIRGINILMSREHMMDTIRDMDERRTYEKRLVDLQLKVAYCKSGYSKDVSDPIVKEAKDLSDDIDSYVEARGENLEDELEEPILDIRKDLLDLGYRVCEGDDDLFYDESLNRHD
jgi:hypothetical protein